MKITLLTMARGIILASSLGVSSCDVNKNSDVIYNNPFKEHFSNLRMCAHRMSDLIDLELNDPRLPDTVATVRPWFMSNNNNEFKRFARTVANETKTIGVLSPIKKNDQLKVGFIIQGVLEKQDWFVSSKCSIDASYVFGIILRDKLFLIRPSIRREFTEMGIDDNEEQIGFLITYLFAFLINVKD